MSEPQIVESQPQPNAPPPVAPSIGDVDGPNPAPVSTPEPAPAPAPEPSQEPTPEPSGEPTPEPAPEQSAIPEGFEDNWRNVLANGDDDVLAELSRVKSFKDIGKRLLDNKKTLSQRAIQGPFPTDGDEATQKAWREQWGVPEEASLKAYGVKAPEGYEMSEVESGFLDEYVKDLHAGNAPKEYVQKSVDKWFQFNEAARQNERTVDEGRHQDWSTEVRSDLGKDYEPVTAAANAYIEQRIPDAETRGELLNARLPGGGILARHPEFIKLAGDLALQNGYGDRIEANAMESSGKPLAEQRMDIEHLRRTDRARYDLPATQERLKKIISLQLSRGEVTR